MFARRRSRSRPHRRSPLHHHRGSLEGLERDPFGHAEKNDPSGPASRPNAATVPRGAASRRRISSWPTNSGTGGPVGLPRQNVVHGLLPVRFLRHLHRGTVRNPGQSGVFEDAHAPVLAVSVDSKFALRAYAEKEGYGFDLLADFWPHGAVARAYGVFDPESGMALRGTFIIDAAGIVRYVVVNPRGQARDLVRIPWRPWRDWTRG